ncbi:MAG: lycopene cyclase [Flavobacteriaceae bacterium]|nr:lycopene cyclase [Flavobacteriaceae bacterium]
MEKPIFDYIICGGGAAGLLLLNALSKDPFFLKKDILLIEKESKNTNDRTWSFWEKKEGPFERLLEKKWDAATFLSSSVSLNFELAPYQYKMLRSKGFYEACHKNIESQKNIQYLSAEVKSLKTEGFTSKVLTSKGSFSSKNVFNSIFDPGALYSQKKYPALKQHFIGWFIKTKSEEFNPNKILFMDFNIEQKKETRFLYVLPLDSKNALVEYTLFSADLLEKKEYEQGIKSYLKNKGITEYEIEEKEQGNIPMSSFPFDQFNTPSLLNIGTAGGWTKASTGFTFMNTSRNVSKVVSFLKTGKPLNHFNIKNRFWFYDLLFLDVLSKYNSQGSKLFERMFNKNSPLTIFRFLDEKTSFVEELKIASSFSLLQISWFLRAIVKRLF